MNKTTIGVYIWGGALIFISGYVVINILWGDIDGDAYKRITGASGALGPIIAATAVAWSWFFQTSQKEKSDKQLSAKLDQLLKEIRAKK